MTIDSINKTINNVPDDTSPSVYLSSVPCRTEPFDIENSHSTKKIAEEEEQTKQALQINVFSQLSAIAVNQNGQSYGEHLGGLSGIIKIVIIQRTQEKVHNRG